MDERFDIVTTDKDGNEYELVYSNSFNLLNKDDSISIKLPSLYKHWVININFKDALPDRPFAVKSEFVDNNVNYTLHGWEAENYIENMSPFVIFDLNKTIELSIKLRSIASADRNFRLINISLWKKKSKS